jgi:hypothetical protein
MKTVPSLALTVIACTAVSLLSCSTARSIPAGSAGMLQEPEAYETLPTVALHTNVEPPRSEDLGDKKYTATVLRTLDFPINQIRINDSDGALLAFTMVFADPAVPNDGLPHLYEWVSFNDDGTIHELGPAAAAPDPCTIRIVVANGETNYECDNDGTCVDPEKCRLRMQLVLGKPTYSCYCGTGAGGGGT